MNKNPNRCQCLAVKPIGNGIWQCMMGNCRRKFIPADVCGKCDQVQADEQLGVKEPVAPEAA